jgi:pimeloyl-ACP methyl ester carboxylesterase
MPTRSAIRVVAASILSLSTAAGVGGSVGQSDVFDRVTHGTAASEGGVKIHYASLGPTSAEATVGKKGPLVLMIHGFPDFWYSWRHQMAALADTHQVVAIDQRGYNLSDKPKGVENYDMRFLVGDVAAVIRHLGRERATIVGHDWGGIVAWQFAMNLPQMTENLVILNLPHPQGLSRELRINAEQIKNSAYARNFQDKMPDDPTVFFGRPMTAENLAGWVRDPAARKHYVEAFKRSDFEAMLNYYKRNYPRQSGADAPPAPEMPKVQAPVLMFHGLRDTALHSDGLSGTWNWVAKDLTLVTAPEAGHFVQQDAADLVTTTMKWWLSSRVGSRPVGQ